MAEPKQEPKEEPESPPTADPALKEELEKASGEAASLKEQLEKATGDLTGLTTKNEELTKELDTVKEERKSARDIRGVLVDQPQRPSGATTMSPPSPFTRSLRYRVALSAASSGERPRSTASQVQCASTSLMTDSPWPVHETAAERSSA